MSEKKTLVLGASENPDRYSHKAALALAAKRHPVVLIGRRAGQISSIPIITGQPDLREIHTITLYLNPQNQKEWYNYILALKPHRIIFNPGAENPELMKKAMDQGIVCENACTLVMLSIGEF